MFNVFVVTFFKKYIVIVIDSIQLIGQFPSLAARVEMRPADKQGYEYSLQYRSHRVGQNVYTVYTMSRMSCTAQY